MYDEKFRIIEHNCLAKYGQIRFIIHLQDTLTKQIVRFHLVNHLS